MNTLPPNSGTALSTWGNHAVIFLAGLGILLWIGGTSAAPVVTAFLAAVIVYWALR